MQDAEEFTPLHPDVLSAPEMADWVQSGKKKIGEVEMQKNIITVMEADKRICLRWCRVKWCWEGRGLPSSAWSPPSSAACWLSLACRLDWERYFRSQRNFDFQTSTAGLLHISVFLVLTLPAILVNRFLNCFVCLFYISMKKVRASKVPVIAPWLDFGADFLGGLGDLCTYRWILVTLA